MPALSKEDCARYLATMYSIELATDDPRPVFLLDRDRQIKDRAMVGKRGFAEDSPIPVDDFRRHGFLQEIDGQTYVKADELRDALKAIGGKGR